MKTDFDLISAELPSDVPYINIYPLGDTHIGSKECNMDRLKQLIDITLQDPYGYVVLCGDMIDNGLKNSKTNVYRQTLSPDEQKEAFYETFLPLAEADKILAGVPGNHCERSVRETGCNPMYDVFCRWRKENVYRENLAIIKITLGKAKNGRKMVYAGIVTHGSSKNKHHKFLTGFDGIDFAISGHTHTPSYTPCGKIRVDTRHNKVIKTGYKEIVVDSHMDSGGYALKNEYEISAPPEVQILRLYGYKKQMDFIAQGL